MASLPSRIPIGLWALALGATGFAAGFFGPIALNPDANQGPLVGIFITGPGGALAGLVLGVIFRLLPISELRRRQTLALSCVTLAVATLYFCLPEPAIRAYVIDAEVEDCAAPTEAADAALVEWQRAVERVTWATPPPDWKQTALRNVAADPGVVLTMRIKRRSTIYEHRKPWNRGRVTAGPWLAADSAERYYSRDYGRSCVSYFARSRELYTPFSDSTSSPNAPAPSWPPTDTTGFLRLQELGPVPEAYKRLLR